MRTSKRIGFIVAIHVVTATVAYAQWEPESKPKRGYKDRSMDASSIQQMPVETKCPDKFPHSKDRSDDGWERTVFAIPFASAEIKGNFLNCTYGYSSDRSCNNDTTVNLSKHLGDPARCKMTSDGKGAVCGP